MPVPCQIPSTAPASPAGDDRHTPTKRFQRQSHYGSPPSQAEITEIVVDRVLLPALTTPATAAR